ncbi:MAG: ATP-binding cassette domain-containing protein [Pseudomonadota bacterium]
MNAIEVSQLQFGFDDQLVIDIDSFSLAQGKSVSVIGPSGCGKTSFLHLLAGLLQPNQGSIHILEQDLSTLQGPAMDRFRGHNIGLVLQRFHLIKSLSVRENILLAKRLSRNGADSDNVDALLTRLGVADVAHHKPSMLSQGQAQRAAIARALIHRPRIVMADEPTSALDDNNAMQAIGMLRDAVAETGATLLVVTHDQRIRGSLDQDFDLRRPS